MVINVGLRSSTQPTSDRTAYLDNRDSASTIPNSSIGHNSIFEPDILKDSISSIFEVGSSHIITTETSFSQVSTTQITIVQASTPEYSTLQIGTTQVSPTQIGSIKISSPQVGITQVSPTQVGSLKIEVGQTQSTQVSPAQINFVTVADKSSKTGISEVNPTQIKTTQSPIIWSPYNFDSSKISLPSSVFFQQLSNTDSFHNLYATLINTYKDNPLNLWSSLFDPTNPLNLTFQITDLPTGQLAEAQITAEATSATSLCVKKITFKIKYLDNTKTSKKNCRLGGGFA